MSLAELFRRFAQPLNALGIPYMATGAVAAVIYGEPRLTLDIDLVLRISPLDISRFTSAFPVAEFEHAHFNLLHLETGLRADIYLAGVDPLDAWGLANRRREEVLGETVWMAPATYVIVRKLEYFVQGGSSKHVSDIQAMLRISPDLIDMPVVKAFVAERGLEEAWQKILAG